MDLTDERPVARRLLRMAGAVAALTGVAGCAELTTEATPTRTRTPTDSPTPRPTPSPTPTASTPNCADRAADLDAKIDRLDREIDEAERTLARQRRTLAELQGIRDKYPNGWAADTVDTARSVGRAIRESILVLETAVGRGTGWFIDDHHVITTSTLADVMDDPVGWTVTGEKVRLEHVARDQDGSPDIALLRTEFAGTPLPTRRAADLDHGTPVVQVGHPRGAGNWLTALGHYLYRRDRNYIGVDPTTVLYSSVTGRDGVAGAPLVTTEGEVIGLTFGSSPREPSSPDDVAPEPADPTVVDYEIAPKVWANHVPIEIVRGHYDAWT